MKKFVFVCAIFLVCALSVAALTGVLRFVKNDRDDPSESTSIVPEESTSIIPEDNIDVGKAPTIDGTWTFKDTILADTDITFEGDFFCSGPTGWSGYGTSIEVRVGEHEPGWSFTEISYGYTDMEPNDSNCLVYNSDTSGWQEDSYGVCKTITFTGKQTVSEAFMNFMNTNAIKLS